MNLHAVAEMILPLQKTSTLKDKYFSPFNRAKLKNLTFSVISNNCLAASIYHKYGLPYTTPTIGTFFFSDEYLRLLESFRHYMAQPLVFEETSAHPEVNELMEKTYKFPVGVLGGDIEILFLHYTSKDEARLKWVRRVGRLNFDNLFILFADSGEAGAGAGGYDFKEEYVERFEALPFEHKVLFSSFPRMGQHVIHIKDNRPDYPYVENMIYNRKFEKYLDVTAWLNGEEYPNNKQIVSSPQFSQRNKTPR